MTEAPARFAHLHIHSNFSFLDGACRIPELVERAASMGMGALAITDHNGLYGAIRFYQSALAQGIKPIIGAEVTLADGAHLVLLAENREGYSNLCKIITDKHLRSCTYETLNRYSDNLIALSGCREGSVSRDILTAPAKARNTAEHLSHIFGVGNFYIELQRYLTPLDGKINLRLCALATDLGLGTVATNNVHYINKGDYRLHDVLRAAGARESLHGGAKRPNAELYLKSAEQMAALFKQHPQAIANAIKIADRCRLDLGLGAFHFPRFELPKKETAYSLLCKLSFKGARKLYKPMSPAVMKRLEHELALIERMGFAQYFLVVRDIVEFAKRRDIYYSGRGSAGDSIISYALNITDADPIANDLLFERFLNPARREMPDIDIDFCSRRRDEVIDYIYKKFGEDKVATVATVSTLNARAANLIVAKAFGFSLEGMNTLSRHFPWVRAGKIRQALREYPELRNSELQNAELGPLVEMAEKLDGFPRHLGTHLGGFIIAPSSLTDFAPLQRAAKGVVVAQYDKDDIAALGLVKMDILGLRMHSAIAEAAQMIKSRTGKAIQPYRLAADDKPTYDLIKTSRNVGLFQLESSGQRNLAARLQQETFSDIVAAISLFRPGPMEAEMIAPFIRRRHGLEEARVCHPELEPIVRDTYGVILYQEQVLQIAAAIAGFSLAEADLMRRAMTKDKSPEQLKRLAELFIRKAMAKGVKGAVADEIWRQLKGFAAYGFCKAHAACFAVLSYASAYLKTHYPGEFLAAILNNQPMGFYSPRVVLNDARHFGLKISPLDINVSTAGFSVEQEGRALRPGLSYVRHMSHSLLERIIQERQKEPFASFEDFLRRGRPDIDVASNLIKVGAFDCMGHGRDALMAALPLLRESDLADSSQKSIITWKALDDSRAPWSNERKLAAELNILGLNISAHPLSFRRDRLRESEVTPSSRLASLPDGAPVKVAGIVERRQTPPTKSGQRTMFLTMEDEEGLLDVVVFASKLADYAEVITHNYLLLVEGRLQNNPERGLAIVAERVAALDR